MCVCVCVCVCVYVCVCERVSSITIGQGTVEPYRIGQNLVLWGLLVTFHLSSLSNSVITVNYSLSSMLFVSSVPAANTNFILSSSFKIRRHAGLESA